MRARIAFVSLGMTLLAAAATAEPGQPAVQAAACDLPGELTLEVTRVIDGDTFKVADGREVRLAGVLAPSPPAGTTAETWIPAVEAKRHLAALVEGRNVVLATGGDRKTDRWGRLLGQVYVAEERRREFPSPLVGEGLGDGRTGGKTQSRETGSPSIASPLKESERHLWVQGEMLAAGFARAYALPERTACIAAMMARERSARDAKLGLWQHAAYAVLDATKPAEILRHRAELVVVEGRVLRATERSGRLYIDFGERWQDDFTVVVPPRVLRETDRSAPTASPMPDVAASGSTRPRDSAQPVPTPIVSVADDLKPEAASPHSGPAGDTPRPGPLPRGAGRGGPSLRDLTGHLVRVRGWIDYRNGPSIELATTEQVELVE